MYLQLVYHGSFWGMVTNSDSWTWQVELGLPILVGAREKVFVSHEEMRWLWRGFLMDSWIHPIKKEYVSGEHPNIYVGSGVLTRGHT